MGMTVESVRFLIEARKAGVSFNRVVTLGRQGLWVSPERLVSLLAGADLLGKAEERHFQQTLAAAEWRFAAFLRGLGADSVAACDASGYEGASLIQDFNRPIPADWADQYDAVIDGGTLEHVFNFPTAIANAMQMVRPGGRLFLFTPGNNYLGHGFYQFSPELFFRVLSAANGFEMERLHAVVDTEGFASFLGVKYAFPIRGSRYAVRDPQELRQRVLLVNDAPVLLFVQARKTASVPPFREFPQQSDYVGQWQDGLAANPLQQSSRAGRLAGWLQRVFTEKFCRETLPRIAGWLDPLRGRRFWRGLSFRNRVAYRRVDGR